MMFNVTRSFACVFSSALYAVLQARPTMNKKPNRMIFRVVIGLFSWSIALREVYCLLSLTASAFHRSTAQECDSSRGLVGRKSVLHIRAHCIHKSPLLKDFALVGFRNRLLGNYKQE